MAGLGRRAGDVSAPACGPSQPAGGLGAGLPAGLPKGAAGSAGRGGLAKIASGAKLPGWLAVWVAGWTVGVAHGSRSSLLALAWTTAGSTGWPVSSGFAICCCRAFWKAGHSSVTANPAAIKPTAATKAAARLSIEPAGEVAVDSGSPGALDAARLVSVGGVAAPALVEAVAEWDSVGR